MTRTRADQSALDVYVAAVSFVSRIAGVSSSSKSESGNPRSTRSMHKAEIHRILQNPLYYGEFVWLGKRYTGSHDPLVSRDVFEQVQAVHHVQIQIGFVRPPILDATLHHLTVQQEPFLVALPVKHPWASTSPVPLPVLANNPFILVPSKLAPGLSHQMMDMCLQAGFQPRMVQEAIQFHVIISLVAAGLGIALVPACIRTFQRPDVVYLPLQGITTQAEIQVVWQRADRSPVVRSFLDVVKAHIHAERTALSDAPD